MFTTSHFSKLLSAVGVFVFALGCSPKKGTDSKVSIKMPGSPSGSQKISQSVSAQSTPWDEMCYLVNITGGTIAKKKKNACEIEKGIASSFIPAGGEVQMNIPQGTGYKLQLLGYQRTLATDTCPTLNADKDLELLDQSKLKELGTKIFDAVGAQTDVPITASIPANNLQTQYSLSSNCAGTGPTLSIANASVTEGSAGPINLTFTVTLNSAATAPITVNYATALGTAEASDHTATTGSINFVTGDTSKTFNVVINGDAIYEGNETISVTLSGGSGYSTSGSTLTAVGTITDDDTPPTIAIANNSFSEGATARTFVVTLTGATEAPVVVNYATSDNTAAAGTDYTSVSNTLTISPPATSGNIVVNYLDDSIDEASEDFAITLSGGSGYTSAGSTLIATATITDDDAAPLVNFASASNTVSESGSATTINVTLSAASGQIVTVPITVGGTATLTTDYTTDAGNLTFAVGELSKTITITPADDPYTETSQTVVLSFGSVTNATVGGTPSYTLTITDDDLPATWIGAVDSNWHTAGNWSDSTVPATGSVAKFNDKCISCNANISAAINVQGIHLESSFTGTLAVSGTFAVTLGTSGFFQEAGTFTASSFSGSTISVGGVTKLAGGTFTAPTGTWATLGFEKLNSPTINPNNGTIKFLALNSPCTGITLKPNGATFFNAEFYAGCSADFDLNGETLYLTNDLAVNNIGTVDNGVIVVGSDATVNGSNGGDATFKFTRSSAAGLTGSGALPNIELANAGLVLNTDGTLRLRGDLIKTAGVISAVAASEFIVEPTFDCSDTFLNVEGSNFAKLTFTSTGACTAERLFTLSGTASVNETLRFSPVAPAPNPIKLNGSSTLNVNGSAMIDSSQMNGGNLLVKMTGGSGTSITGYVGAKYPRLEIATGGSINLYGEIGVAEEFKFTSGSVTAGSSKVIFYNLSGATGTFDGGTTAMSFFDLEFKNVTGSGPDVDLPNAISVSGTLGVHGASGSCYGLDGTINLTGNLSSTCTAATVRPSSIINFYGSTNSNWSFSGTFPVETLQVNKTATYGVTAISGGPGYLYQVPNLNMVGGDLRMQQQDLDIDSTLTMAAGTALRRNLTNTAPFGVITLGVTPIGNGSYGSGVISDY